ncbi:hypothetical protein M514_07835 [Trichuris suis]|uniref:Uncharacterized protein n=1 Tax=Trichuris suis TaxID=68888 RepID=A0A085N5D2_9BILA|nr:hypothetical protein M513_07835 [Trichuris suis]KFD64678.1 hypothetical protein M514_07835 [Trichuris suis]
MFLKRLPLPVSLLCREWLKNHTLAEAAYMADVHFPLQAEFTASAATVQAPAGDSPSYSALQPPRAGSKPSTSTW